MTKTGWIGRKHNHVKWFIPGSRRGAWRLKGYRLVRVATPEECALFEAFGGTQPVLLSRLVAAQEAKEREAAEATAKLALPPPPPPPPPPASSGEGESMDESLPSPEVVVDSPAPTPSKRKRR